MVDFRLAEKESRFAELIWDNAPISSPELVRLSAQVLNWKKSTTYTVLKRLCNRGIFRNEGATVVAVISREEFLAGRSRRFVEDAFGGSLPSFLTAFIGGGKLSDKQTQELIRLINEHRED